MPQFPSILNLSTLDGVNGFKISGALAPQYLGTSVSSAGDLNGDGFDDILIGAFFASPNGASSGASYVVFGKAPGFTADLNLSTLDGSNGFQINGELSGDLSGQAVSAAGDVNGDGFADILVGTTADKSYVVFGTNSGFPTDVNLSTLDGSNGFQLNGEAPYNYSGRSVSSAGDVNGDGFDDILIGAGRADPNGSDSGASYVVFGKASGFAATLNLSAIDGSNGFQINGEALGDLSGLSVFSAGDVNADGFDDILIGATGANPNGSNSGASYVVFGHRALASVTITGTDLAQTTNGGYGDDMIDARDGNDTLFGWEGNDTIIAGVGNDTVDAGSEDDTVAGGSGDDTVSGGEGDDVLDGGAGLDTINGGDGDDMITGGAGNDTINSGDGDDMIAGGAGNDRMTGGAGNDIIKGGSGVDIFVIGAGEDEMDGGSEKDMLDFSAFGATAISVNLGSGQYLHSNGEDIQTFKSIEDVLGGAGGDTITGNFVSNVLNGGGGNDLLNGAAGDDAIVGGAGKDAMAGGAGADRFIYTSITHSSVLPAGRDAIVDFTVNAAATTAHVDRIVLSAIDARASTGGDQAFVYIGQAAFSTEGQIRATQVGADTLVEINTTAASGAEMSVLLTGFTATTLSQFDFVL